MSSAETCVSSALARCMSSHRRPRRPRRNPAGGDPRRPRPLRPRNRCERSSPMSSASSRSCTASPNWRWSSITPSSRSRSRPARSSISGRHRSTSLRRAGGGARPVSRSRTIIASASSIGASARSVISSNLLRWKRSSSMAVRFLATPSMRRAPIASTRACSTASNTARACWPAGCRRRCSGVSWQASLQRDRIGMAAHDRGLVLAELARRLRQPHLAAHQAGPLGGEGDLQLRLARHRAHAAGHRALERLGGRFLRRRISV